MYTMQKTTFYYVIVHKKSGKMLLDNCKVPIYWNLKTAQERCSNFSEMKVIKVPAKEFNELITDSHTKTDKG